MAAPKLHQATAIIDVALAEARKKHFAPRGVAVLDAGGHLEASKREESNLIPTDARGGSARVGELIRRGLVSPEMILEAVKTAGTLLCWPSNSTDPNLKP